MGGADVDRRSLLEPDRRDVDLRNIFTEPGQVAFHHFGLVEGFTTRARVTYLGERAVRVRGEVTGDWIDAGRLVREPERARDLRRRGEGG